MRKILAALGFCGLLAPAAGAQPAAALADFEPLAAELQAFVETSDVPRFLALLAPGADRAAARDFASRALQEGITRAVVLARFAAPAEDAPDGSRYHLTVEAFTESGNRARLQTWQLDVVPAAADDGGVGRWRIDGHQGPDTIDGLHHLELHPERQFDAAGFAVSGEDMQLRMARGAAFVAEIDSGITGLLLVGDGLLTFSPAPAAERRQIEIFSGQETLEAAFTHAFVRINPLALAALPTAELTPAAVDAGALDSARELFDELARKTFVVDFSDFSDRTWWLAPRPGNLVAEIRTEEYGDLTFTQTAQRHEDVSLYSRDPARVIALYASARKRAERGRYHDPRERAALDLLDYDIDALLEPRGVGRESLGARPTLLGCWIEATARLAIRARAPLDSLTLHLAEELEIRSVTSNELGALLHFRMRGRDDVIINLPAEAPAGTEFTIVVRYAGLLEADELQENWLGRRRFLDGGARATYGIPERRYLYTNASRWYPQPAAADYATATLTLAVPAEYGVVASGDPLGGNPPAAGDGEADGWRTFSFVTTQPARYLACLITRFAPGGAPPLEIALDRAAGAAALAGAAYDSLLLSVEANDFGRDRAAERTRTAADILRFYASLIGDLPYPALTLALVDSRLPGGHSPAYFTLLNQPLPVHGRLMQTWRTDPVAFSDYPSFFLAHELAHQWWGQAVGWRSYHEQWLSEGFAQYFAALYIRETGGEEAFVDVLSQLRRWSLRHADQGPIYLGYRLGHLQDEPRVFRALVYNKSALVLHMLRRLVGDSAFFRGLRRFYGEMRFEVAGTDDLIRAFEAEAGRSLETFFVRWIHEFGTPALRFDYRTEARRGESGAADIVLRFRQDEPAFEIPVTVTLTYRSGRKQSVIVPVSGPATEQRVPLEGALRGVEVNRDNAALAEIERVE